MPIIESNCRLKIMAPERRAAWLDQPAGSSQSFKEAANTFLVIFVSEKRTSFFGNGDAIRAVSMLFI